MKNLTNLILLFCLISSVSFGQYHDAKWVLCSGDNNFQNNVILDFNNGQSPVVQLTNTYVPMLGENASISDAWGNLLFFTNGTKVFDKNLNFISGGNLTPPRDTIGMYLGASQIRGCIFLPYPGDSSKYVLLHTTREFLLPMSYPGWVYVDLPRHLYMTVLDKNLNSGNGGIVSINQVLLTDTLSNWGCFAVTKHANGRDWWIVVKKHYRNIFYKLLLTPSGIQNMGTQQIGLDNQARTADYYIFSPNGEVLAGGIGAHNLVLFNFDRCSGLISNHQLLNNPISPNDYADELDFSPDSRFLYSAERHRIFQYDLQNIFVVNAVQNSRLLVADTSFTTSVCDSPSNGLKTEYTFGELAADGKIYYTANYSCQEFSYFESPDSLGLLSNFNYGGLNITNLNAGAVPNFPNYRLGAVVGSICDSITSINDELAAGNFIIYPNPARDYIKIKLTNDYFNFSVKLYSIQGSLIQEQMFSYGHEFTFAFKEKLSPGIYLLEVESKEGRAMKKLVVQ